MSTPNLLNNLDCVIDIRSTGLEHWSYNVGLAKSFQPPNRAKAPRIIYSAETARVCNHLGLEVEAREWEPTIRSRLVNFLIRQFVFLFLVFKIGFKSKNILIVHAHPVVLFMALPLLKILRCKTSLVLHNDILSAFRKKCFEDWAERQMWRIIILLSGNLTLLVPNKYFRRYLIKIKNTSKIVILPHPVLKEHDYTSVAGEIMNSFENYSMGYFGRVEAGRGLNKYLKIVDKTPLKKFLVAGKSAGKIGFRKNLDAFEKPETRIYCGLLLKCDQIFIDLSDESYRLGESGVFWDAVGLSKTIVFGNVPKMHRKRINELRITNKGVPQFNWI